VGSKCTVNVLDLVPLFFNATDFFPIATHPSCSPPPPLQVAAEGVSSHDEEPAHAIASAELGHGASPGPEAPGEEAEALSGDGGLPSPKRPRTDEVCPRGAPSEIRVRGGRGGICRVLCNLDTRFHVVPELIKINYNLINY